MDRDDVMRETVRHTKRVGELMTDVVAALMRRAVLHDESRFSEAEFESFAQETPKLRELTYGSDDYKEALSRIQPAIQKHYERNSHHPEHFSDGINDMTLLDLMEMLADWKAATERHADGDLRRSIDQNAERFKYDDVMRFRLKRTAAALGWI